MTWIWIAFIGLGVFWVGAGLLYVLWAAFEMVLLLFRKDEWRDYPSQPGPRRRHHRKGDD